MAKQLEFDLTPPEEPVKEKPKKPRKPRTPKVSIEQKPTKSKKEIATSKGEPYVEVLATHVDPNDLRNGFFEIDWNDIFVLKLRQNGFGVDGDSDESVVDRWFRNLCYDVATEADIDMTDRTAGYVNVIPLANGRAEIG